MALTATSITGAVAQGATTIKLTSATGAAVGMLAIVDGETMLISDVSLTPVVGVVRGYNGTVATAHATLAPTIFGLTTDFSTPTGGPFVTLSTDQTLAWPTVDTTFYITKAGVCAITQSAPAADLKTVCTFISLTANAHTIDYAAGYYADTTSSNLATFAAKNGASATFVAKSGTLGVVALANVTIG